MSSTTQATTDLSSVNLIFDKIYSLIKSQGKSFTASDIFNVISATIQAVNAFFATASTTEKVSYVVDIVQGVLSKLTAAGVIPSEIGFIISLIPLKLIVEFTMKFFIQSNVAKPKLGNPEDILEKLSIKSHTGLVSNQ